MEEKSTGKTIGQVYEFLKSLEKFGWNDRLMQKVIMNKELAQDVVLMVAGAYELTQTVIIPRISILKGRIFTKKQSYTNSFEKLFLEGVSDTITIKGQEVNIFTLISPQNDFEICDELGEQSFLNPVPCWNGIFVCRFFVY